MSHAASRVAAHVVRAWYRLVTAGLSADVRDRLREEIESDLWEYAHEPWLSDTRAALHMLGRLSSSAAMISSGA